MRIKLLYLSFLLLFVCSCNIILPRTRIIDERGKPISGAIVYFEITSGNPADFDPEFVFTKSDENGYAPPLNKPQLRFNNRFSYYIQFAILAEGKAPFSKYDHNKIFDNPEQNLQFVLSEPESYFSYCGRSNLIDYEYPFTSYPKLKKELIKPKYSILRIAFKRSYETKCVKYLDLTHETIEALKRENIPETILNKFKGILHLKIDKFGFKAYLQDRIGKEATENYFELFYRHVGKKYSEDLTRYEKYREIIALERVVNSMKEIKKKGTIH